MNANNDLFPCTMHRISPVDGQILSSWNFDLGPHLTMNLLDSGIFVLTDHDAGRLVEIDADGRQTRSIDYLRDL